MATDGHIQLIFGPMFSGKTTELIKRIKRLQIANNKCLVIKYARDNRYEEGNFIATHERTCLPAVSTTLLQDIKHLLDDYDVIGVDEGQFFKDVVEFSEEVANMGKIVIVAALDGTYQRKGFGEILALVPLAEHIVKLNAVCMVCYRDAAFTKRKGSETQIELIGGKDTYMSVCRTCFMSPDCSRKKLFGDVTNKNDMGMSKMHTSNAKIGGDTVNHEIVSLHTTNHNE